MKLQSILVATDFSDCSGAAFQTAAALAETYNAKIVLLHVINWKRLAVVAEYLGREPESLVPELRERAQSQLADFLKRWNSKGLQVETIVAVGAPFQEIAVIARDLAVDLIALGGYGAAGRGPVEEVFFGSTAEKVVRLLPCPVLCVPMEAVCQDPEARNA
jgi:nucleotide-binding universal stress UspA family protein|uniref:Universal stress protein n=1 Tax=Desulfobacca acetoxidans TaxID=60893 RepID=A0A7C5ALF4_9BACT